ncbi:MAG TPA: methylated-DNA--[protein]-cysteine S-methyltransferase [Micavibrio sp.]|nr:methylated-DNA--[protein]-cysteine S-methyltransferase [Micavibrio sp.]
MNAFNEAIIAEAIDYLVANYDQQPDLSHMAERAGYEVTHFQKMFKDYVGISPKRLVQFMNMRHARQLMLNGSSTQEAALFSGLSSTGRLYDLFVSCEAVTPGEVKQKGEGLTVTYGFHPTPLGEVMVCVTPRGVCYLGFLMDEARDIPIAKMQHHLPNAAFIANDDGVRDAVDQILRIWAGRGDEKEKLKLDLHGTNMQIQVWQALLKIPTGVTKTYQEIGVEIGKPKAARAIGNAVGANPISLLIPCHRVIRGTGIIDNYGWGSPRKKLLLGLESEYLAHRV